VQVYDWDGDGWNEVLWVRQARYLDAAPSGARERAPRYEGNATMVVLDGRTGREKGAFPLPAPADDCFLFLDLTGRGRREDLLVKDRYWNLWGVSHEGKVLWQWTGSPGHFPAYGDVDGDGRDEVFVGFALIDHDGRARFAKDPRGAHQDAAYAVRLRDGAWRLLFGNSGIHCLSADGAELWHHPLGEAQHVVAGRFRSDSEVQFMVIDRGRERRERGEQSHAVLCLYDLDGRELWRRQGPEGSWATAIVPIDWLGGGKPACVLAYGRGAGQPALIYDGDGTIVDTLPMQYTPDRTPEDRRADFYATRADLWGDSREEAILFGSRGACIYANPRPLALPTHYNNTLYPGM
jgi:outer membrane protein assembly factor BamB